MKFNNKANNSRHHYNNVIRVNYKRSNKPFVCNWNDLEIVLPTLIARHVSKPFVSIICVEYSDPSGIKMQITFALIQYFYLCLFRTIKRIRFRLLTLTFAL